MDSTEDFSTRDETTGSESQADFSAFHDIDELNALYINLTNIPEIAPRMITVATMQALKARIVELLEQKQLEQRLSRRTPSVTKTKAKERDAKSDDYGEGGSMGQAAQTLKARIFELLKQKEMEQRLSRRTPSVTKTKGKGKDAESDDDDEESGSMGQAAQSIVVSIDAEDQEEQRRRRWGAVVNWLNNREGLSKLQNSLVFGGKALRARIMPPTLSPKDVLVRQSWRDRRNLLQNRSNSTAQEARIEDESASAIIHGNKSTNQSHRPSNHERSQGEQRSSKSQPKPSRTQKPPSQKVRRVSPGAGMQPQGQKRKASAADAPPAQRPRESAQVELKNEAYIRRTLHVPTQQDYPSLPTRIFEKPKQSIHEALQGPIATLERHSEPLDLRQGGFRCTVSCDELDIPAVVGEAFSKVDAETAAYVHFIAKAHELGTFTEIYEINNAPSGQATSEERDAKTDIYNYAARFDCIPEVTVRSVEKARTRGQQRRKMIEVTFTMPEQNIKATGLAAGLEKAELMAALRFKREAEKFQKRQGTESLVVKDSSTLTTGNARAFFEYYKIIHPRSPIDVVITDAMDLRVYGGRPFRAHLRINQQPIGKAMEMFVKKKAQDLAYLVAALDVKNREPDIYPGFLKALRAGNGEIIRPVPTMDMPVHEDCLLTMRQTLLDARRTGLPDEAEEIIPDEDVDISKRSTRRALTEGEIIRRHWHLQQVYTTYLFDPRLEQLRKKRSELPMSQYKSKVLDLVSHNLYSIIIGATGSGKTTQVPQIILEDAIANGRGGACNVVCTQPRRIAATSVAQRVAEERSENLQESVGYHVRFDAKLPQLGGSINYCTTGILLAQLQRDPDGTLDRTSHIVVDEVHERDIMIDFLLIILKKVVAQRQADGKAVPKIILMSATMDADLFASYFSSNVDEEVVSCPTLSVPGRAFPVKERYLDNIMGELKDVYTSSDLRLLTTDTATRDYMEADRAFTRSNPLQENEGQTETVQPDDFVIDWKKERKLSIDGEDTTSTEKEDALIPHGLIATTVAHISKTTTDGAILVFLPGLDDIVQVDKLLRGHRVLGVDVNDKSKYELYMLHSSLPAGQKEVFREVAAGCRKIILATNIAETSITIPDVQHVVDSGKLREKQYNQVSRITKLQCTWVSKSNAKQRAGRAGRVQNGNYYALFSKSRYESLRAIGLPEMLRADLQEICLDIKAQAFQTPIRDFLAAAIEPPSPKAVDSSVLNLQALDALTDDERITPLGRLLASLPVHPSLGKMIVLGIIFRCLDPMLIVGAAAGERALFINPLEARKEAQAAKISFVDGSGSDHIATINAVRKMRTIRDQRNDYYMRDFGNQHFIHNNAFKAIESTAKQIEGILVEAGLIPFTPPYAQAHSEYGDPALNENSQKTPLIKALIMAGLHPNLAVNTGGRSFRTTGEKGVIVHPSSINAPKDRKSKDESPAFGTLYSYTSLSRSNDGHNLSLRDTTLSTPLIATLFGGRLRHDGGNILEMDGWLPFYVKSSQRIAAKTIFEFRKAMERLFSGVFKDLAVKRKVEYGEETRFLADDKVREIFAQGVVEVLMRDVRTDDRVAKMGLGGTGEETERMYSWTPKERDRQEGVRGKPGFYRDLLAGKY